MAYISVEHIRKQYKIGEVTIQAVEDISFDVDKGEFVVVVGPSGAGKTTVLNILGGMDTVSEGRVSVDGRVLSDYSPKQMVEYRRNDVGFVFQFYNLITNLTALENVELATQICKDALNPKTILESVGLTERMDNFPSQLSGGEQQRVAIARALAKNPKLLLCDEPTGALDTETGQSVLKLLQSMAAEYQMTVILITHNLAITPMAHKVIHIRNGKVAQIEINEHPVSAQEITW